MAVIYFTLTFSPDKFRVWLREQIVVEGRVDDERLAAVARSITADPNPDTAWALMAMRYGDDWFDPAWFDDLLGRYHLIIFAAQMRRVAGPDFASLAILRAVLPHLGWSAEQISLLTSGEPLGTLGSALRDPLLHDAIALGGSGGWLPSTQIKALHAQLADVAPYFLAPTRELLIALRHNAGLADLEDQALTEKLRTAYLAEEAMLATALVRREALYLMLD